MNSISEFTKEQKGFSILICSYNGAARIEPTLSHLAKQKFSEAIPWEVVLVDNASKDGLAAKARSLWQSDVPLRIISEPRLGITFARQTGMRACRYSYIGIVDDDNWVSENWVEKGFQIIDAHPEVAALGGSSTAAFEISAPAWFGRYSRNFAVGDQYEKNGLIEKGVRQMLWGAGLVLRKQAIEELWSNGFESIIESRMGKGLKSGEDTEIIMALCLMGWRLYYDQSLTLVHYITKDRLNWDYYLKLREGLGATAVYLQLYRDLLLAQGKDAKPRHTGQVESILLVSWKLIKDPLALIAGLSKRYEGNYRVAKTHFLIGALRTRLIEKKRLAWAQKMVDQQYARYLNPERQHSSPRQVRGG